MPYSEIPDPLPQVGDYRLAASIDVPGSGTDSISINMAPDILPGLEPDWDVLDAWFQSVVDHMANLPGITSLNASKGMGFALTVTPTEESTQ